MTIYDYVNTYQITQSELARRVGVSRSTIVKYYFFEREPTLEIALKLQKVSKGKITLKEMLKENADLRLQVREEDML